MNNCQLLNAARLWGGSWLSLGLSQSPTLFNFFFFKGDGLEDNEGRGGDSAETLQGAVAVRLRRIYIAEHHLVVRKSLDREMFLCDDP